MHAVDSDYNEVGDMDSFEQKVGEYYQTIDCRYSYERKKKPTPTYDETGVHALIKDEYLLGDVLFLKTGSRSKLEYRPDEEVHFGNNGMAGSIYSNLALIVTLPSVESSDSKIRLDEEVESSDSKIRLDEDDAEDESSDSKIRLEEDQ
jgi:hypothetical protein